MGALPLLPQQLAHPVVLHDCLQSPQVSLSGVVELEQLLKPKGSLTADHWLEPLALMARI